MSAINPASFVTPPSAGLSGPGGITNPLYNQEPSHADKRQQERGYGPRDPDTGRDIPNPVGVIRNFTDSYQPFGQPSRQVDAGQPDPFAPHSPTSYGPLETGFADYAPGSSPNARMHPGQSEWAGRFQGLSLNS
jgi:hypothetical protein